MTVEITFDGRTFGVEEGITLISAAAACGVYIPAVCNHPDLRPFADLPLADRVFRGSVCFENEPLGAASLADLEGCGLCVVEVEGGITPVRACRTAVTAGMSVRTRGEALTELRRGNLMRILARHPHACLTCAQREGCSLESCSANVPKEERCCNRFHDCELRRVAEHIGVKAETPRYQPSGLSALHDEPLFSRNYDLCIDCARCVRVCNQVRGVGALGVTHTGGRLVVGSIAPSLIESACKFCGACVEVCPTGCLEDRAVPVGDKRRWLVPCVGSCPAGVDVPEYIRCIAQGDSAAAAAVVWESLPLPNVLAYVCFHVCENQCRRGEVDEPIAICALKRFALASTDSPSPAGAVKPADTGKKVAVVGAGPAGLSAAFFLRLKGHAVTVFEASDSPGGMPALSIPRYRLPQSVLEKDIAVIRDIGVEIKACHGFTSGQEMSSLLDAGFDALLIAIGLPYSKRLPVAGADLPGVFSGLEFLKAARAGTKCSVGSLVVVIGGGNVAIDGAMTALRLSQGTVRLFCLERREEMPAHNAEVGKALAEGVELNNGWGPVAIHGAPGGVNRVELRRCLSVFDNEGNFAPTFDDQRTMWADADTVILAIGQAAPDYIPDTGRGVFLAGDIAGGDMSVVHAVASGRRQAQCIDRYLGSDGVISMQFRGGPTAEAWIGREEGFAPRRRIDPPCALPSHRRYDFREIEHTYSAEGAVLEARRCLQCDLRLQLSQPPRPPEDWQAFNYNNVKQVPAVAGVVVLCDSDKRPMIIKGAQDVRAALNELLESSDRARFFQWEEDRMYTKRESELIQQHVKEYGELPGGEADELDDLF